MRRSLSASPSLAPRRPARRERAGSDRWMVSYADFITLLFAFFVVLFAVSRVDPAKLGSFAESIQHAFRTRAPTAVQGLATGDTPPAPRTRALYRELEQGLAALPFGPRIQLAEGERGVTLTLPESLCFRPDTATLLPEALPILDALARLLAGLGGSIRVEGHTDARPPRSPLFATNWELSSLRAARVVRHLVEKGGLAPTRIAAVGLADARPLEQGGVDFARATSRRIELVVVAEE